MASAGTPPAWRSRVQALVGFSGRGCALLVPSEGGWGLPRVEVAGFAEDDLRNTAHSLEEKLGEPVTILRYASYASDEDAKILDIVYVLEDLPSEIPPAGGEWVTADALANFSFAVPEERELVASHLAELERGAVPERRVPWACAGWFDEATAWIEESLAAKGAVPSGRIEQKRAWCLSCVLRVPTSTGNVFFKATVNSPLFVDEGRVMRGLARIFPKHVPRPLAVDRSRRWMLLGDLGPELGWSAPLDVRELVLRLFGLMQITSSEHIDELFAIGCVDRSPEWLARQARKLLADDAALVGLDEAEVAKLRALEPRLVERCERLAKGRVPNALVHGDLHLSNVAPRNGDYVFFDWSDAAVTHPFLDLIDIVFERDGVVRMRLRDAYLSMWHDFAPMDELLELWKTAEPLISLNQAVSYRHILANVEPGATKELDWALPYFLRKVLAAETPQAKA